MRFILAFFIVLIPKCFAEVPSPIPTEPVYKDCSISQCGGVCKLEGGGKGVCKWTGPDTCDCMPIVDCSKQGKSTCNGSYCLNNYGGGGFCMWLPLVDDIDPRGKCVCNPRDSEDFDCSCNGTTPIRNPECAKDSPCIGCRGDCYDGQVLNEQCICKADCSRKIPELENSYDLIPCTCNKGKCTKKKKTKKTEMY